MRAVIQRVDSAKVTVDKRLVGKIGTGILVLLGVNSTDNPEDTYWMSEKIINLRIFSDENGKMNKSLLDVQGEILVVSQFTLYGDCRKGRRPSYSDAAPPEKAEQLYELFIEQLISRDIPVATGEFGAHMKIDLINDGPVTLIISNDK